MYITDTLLTVRQCYIFYSDLLIFLQKQNKIGIFPSYFYYSNVLKPRESEIKDRTYDTKTVYCNIFNPIYFEGIFNAIFTLKQLTIF